MENTGTYPVQEAVQVYVRFSEREACDPGYQLKGIRSVALECGEKKEVCITLSPRDFALISEEGKCLVHPGSYEITDGEHTFYMQNGKCDGSGILMLPVSVALDEKQC